METIKSSDKSMDRKKIEEEKKLLKKEETEKKEKEVSDKIAEIETAFKSVKINKDELKENFNKSIKSVLALYKKKVKNDKINENLYLCTAKMIELQLVEKDLSDFADSLTNEEKAELVKFFYLTYERFSKKLNCLTLKPPKIYNIHQSILEKQGVGIVSRALFSIQK